MTLFLSHTFQLQRCFDGEKAQDAWEEEWEEEEEGEGEEEEEVICRAEDGAEGKEPQPRQSS